MIEATWRSYQSVFAGLYLGEIFEDLDRLSAGEVEKLNEHETKNKDGHSP